jgi:hypothetical protein
MVEHFLALGLALGGVFQPGALELARPSKGAIHPKKKLKILVSAKHPRNLWRLLFMLHFSPSSCYTLLYAMQMPLYMHCSALSPIQGGF